MANQLETETSPPQHFVHLYGAADEGFTGHAADYFHEALSSGDALLIVAEGKRLTILQEILRDIGEDVESASSESRLIFCDAHDALAQFMVDGLPRESLFKSAMGRIAGEGQRWRRICVYGEMVGVLWKAGDTKAAMVLEQFWNGLLTEKRIAALLCGYPIDVFSQDFTIAGVDEILREHTCLLPTYSRACLEFAVARALNHTIGPQAEKLKGLVHANFCRSWGAVPSAEATILWIRHNLPELADEILSRAHRSLVLAGTST